MHVCSDTIIGSAWLVLLFQDLSEGMLYQADLYLNFHDMMPSKGVSWLFLIQKLRFQYSYIHTTLTPKQYLKSPRQWGKHLSAGYCHTGPCHLRHLIFYSCGTQNTQDFPFQISFRIHGKYQLQRNIVRTISLLTSNTFQPLRGEVGKQDRFS